jgi:hypothetical protein
VVSARAVALAVLAAALHAAPVHAQAQARRYRIMAGVSVNWFDPFDVDTGTHFAPGLMLRGVPRAGFGPVIDLSGVNLDLKRGPRGQPLGELHALAPMAGIGYTLERGQWASNLHVAVGWGFNSVDTEQPLIDADGARFDVKNGPVLRSGLTFTRFLGNRFAATTSFGYLRMAPSVELAFTGGDGGRRTETGTWKTSGLYWGVGAAFKIF